MNSVERKKVSVISKYILESFSQGDWLTLGQITGQLKIINDHSRLFRSLYNGDDDYDYCVAEVLDSIFTTDSALIPDVINHFDIDLWYEQKEPEKYKRVFVGSSIASADFWKDGYFKVFVSHLSSNRERMSAMKSSLSIWGISAFIAHEDIEASKEWRDEVEAGLETMELLVAVVEPGFKESDWCAQEVGYALGRKIDIIPLRAGLDPFGFFGKYQGIQIKGKYPEDVASEIVQTILKKPKHRDKLLQCIITSFGALQSSQKSKLIKLFYSWSIATNDQLLNLLEQVSLTEPEKRTLSSIISKVGAFKPSVPETTTEDDFDEIPF